jgi:diaminopimelate decarboxylase/aspartate kinase
MSTSDTEPVVLKFGGTSVATRDRWDRIAAIVRQRIREGTHPLLVCSAVSEVSDALEEVLHRTQTGDWRESLESVMERHRKLADELDVDLRACAGETLDELERLLRGASLVEEVSPNLRARVMSAGELISSRLGAAYLSEQGIATEWLDARESLTARAETPRNGHRRYLSATCGFDRDAAFRRRILGASCDVHLTQGFIARDPGGETVLLGRGGSDTSASCFAGKVGAERVEIWTDVHGLFTANPAQVPSARLLEELDYDEAQELATMGAEVLHPRCIDPVREHGIPLRVRCIGDPATPGTRISDDTPEMGAQVKAISAKTGVTLISMETLGMWQEVGFLADAFSCFEENGLSIDMMATSETNVTVSLDPTANALEEERIQRLLEDLDAHCRAEEIGPCAAVSLVGRQIRSILDELGPALEVFDEQRVHLVSQAASDLNFTFVVDEGQAQRLVRELHALLFGDRGEDRLLGPTWRELTGEAPSAETPEDRWWVDRRDELLEIVSSSGPTYVYDRDRLETAVDELEEIGGVDRRFFAVKANPNPEILRFFEERGLGFECVSPGEIRRILELCPDIDRDRILFTPNFAPREEYEYGFERDVWVTVDNVEPLERWPETFRGREVLLRLDPGRGRGHHEFVRTAGPQSKFGIAPEQLGDVEELVDDLDLSVVGLHAHLGSGIKEPAAWAETVLSSASAR